MNSCFADQEFIKHYSYSCFQDLSTTLTMLNLAKHNYNYFDLVSCFAQTAFRSFGRRIGLSFKQQHWEENKLPSICIHSFYIDWRAASVRYVPWLLNIFCTGRIAWNFGGCFPSAAQKTWLTKVLNSLEMPKIYLHRPLNHKIRFLTYKADGLPAQVCWTVRCLR